MPYDLAQHHRRSIRLQGYDYSQAGAYFVTIVTHRRPCLFGDIAKDEMLLNATGQMIAHWWLELAHKFPRVTMDEFVIMPNHLHGILVMADRDGASSDLKDATPAVSFFEVMQWFKTMTTNEYIRGVKTLLWPPFAHKFWQRNYYERVIRDEEELQDTREYIKNNPAQWALDRENPNRGE